MKSESSGRGRSERHLRAILEVRNAIRSAVDADGSTGDNSSSTTFGSHADLELPRAGAWYSDQAYTS